MTKNNRPAHGNGHAAATVLPPSITAIAAVKLTSRNQALAGAELDQWDDELAALDRALRDKEAAAALLADASRRVELARERCRLLRAAIAVQLAAGSET